MYGKMTMIVQYLQTEDSNVFLGHAPLKNARYRLLGKLRQCGKDYITSSDIKEFARMNSSNKLPPRGVA